MRLPVADLPDLILKIAARTEFAGAFTHISERASRASDLDLTVCAVLLAEARNTGFEPLIRYDVPALCRDRLSWVNQNFVRDETLIAANALLIRAQNNIALAHVWGGGEVASVDGIRFVVPAQNRPRGLQPQVLWSRTRRHLLQPDLKPIHEAPWHHGAGALRASLLLFALVLEQQMELQPAQTMTDTGAYSDVVFDLFRLLGFRFSPRLANMGGARFWRIDPHANYGLLNDMFRHRGHLSRIAENWDDFLRLGGSLKLGRVPATGIMRTLQGGERPTRLAQRIAEFGRIEKTIHALTFIDNEAIRRSTLIRLNRGEARHGLSRVVFHGKRGELRQRYSEGQEDQLGALGLVVNMSVLWNTFYLQAAFDQLCAEGFPVLDSDVPHLNPHLHEHSNLLGRYSFSVSESVSRGELRPSKTSPRRFLTRFSVPLRLRPQSDEKSYKANELNILELVDVSRASGETKDDYVDASYGYQRAWLNLERAADQSIRR